MADIQARLKAMEEWLALRERCPWPEQQRYEILRSVVLFGHSPAERAVETGVPRASLYRRVRRFKELGMVSLFTDVAADERPARPTSPPDMRQFIVDLKAEYAPFRPNEIATICELKFGRRPSPHTVQRVLADGPPPSRATRRYPPYHRIADPADARHAVVTLHYEGWNAKGIAAYLGTSRQTVHAILRRWIEEGRFGLDDKAPGPKSGVRKADFRAVAAIKKLQKNELLGEFGVSAALKQMGIRVPPRTCGRIMAHHWRLYGIGQHTKGRAEKKLMPFAASRRHGVWTTDIRYLDTPLLGQQAYCITILDNFSRAIVASIVSPKTDRVRAAAGAYWEAGGLRGVEETTAWTDRTETTRGAAMRANEIRMLFDYTAWANARILDAAARVPAAEFTRAALGPCRLHDTLRHILQAEVFWRSEWQGVADASTGLPATFPTVEALRARWAEETQALDAFLGTLTDEDLRRRVTDPSVPPETLGQQLLHLVIHGVQHRSEAALLLTHLGQSPGWMDLLPYLNLPYLTTPEPGTP